EVGVVGDEVVAVGEGDQLGELFGPAGGALNIRRPDAVDAGVPFEKRVVPRGRPDVPPGFVDDAPLPHFDEADRAGGCARRVGGLEVDCGEVQGHKAMLSRAPDVAAVCGPRATVPLTLVALTIAIV